MSIGFILLANACAIALLFAALWLLSLYLRDASIIDMIWGGGFALVALVTIANVSDPHPRAIAVAGLVTLWGLRLSGYLTWRNWGKPEDHRYAEMRQRRGKSFPLVSLYLVFGLQGLLMWIISLPIQFGIPQADAWHPIFGFGLVLFLIGLVFESVGDFQLARFKANPDNKGHVMDRGLWRYTRHPNYFGDFMVWWGIYLIAFSAASWWTIIGPVIMSFFLIRVSGVPMLESSLKSRIKGYDQYLESTSSFFPWPPRELKTVAENAG